MKKINTFTLYDINQLSVLYLLFMKLCSICEHPCEIRVKTK